MAYYYHRKFLNETLNDPNIELICKPYCNGEKAQDGPCPIICLGICPSICSHPLFLPFPPAPAVVVDKFPTAYEPPPEKHNTLSLLIIIFLSVFAAIFFLLACYTIYKFYSRWRDCRAAERARRQPPEEELVQDHYFDEDHLAMINPIWYIRTVGLQPSVISAITIAKYKKGDGLIEGTDCSVCLNEFQEDETLRLLPKCNHAFHIPCIDTWLRSHTNCPMCRASIVTNNTSSLPPQDQIVHNPGSVEETRVDDISDENHEPVGETEQNFTVDIVDEDEGEDDRQSQNESKIHGNGRDFGVLEVQPMRRSVSLDSLSASMIRDAFKSHPSRNSDNQLVDAEKGKRDGNNKSPVRLEASSSSNTQTGPSSIKERSLSCSAKVLLLRYNNRSWNSDISR